MAIYSKSHPSCYGFFTGERWIVNACSFLLWGLVQQSAKHTSDLYLYPTPVFLNYVLPCLVSLPSPLSNLSSFTPINEDFVFGSLRAIPVQKESEQGHRDFYVSCFSPVIIGDHSWKSPCTVLWSWFLLRGTIQSWPKFSDLTRNTTTDDSGAELRGH